LSNRLLCIRYAFLTHFLRISICFLRIYTYVHTRCVSCAELGFRPVLFIMFYAWFKQYLWICFYSSMHVIRTHTHVYTMRSCLCAEIVEQSYCRVEDITGKQTPCNPWGLKTVCPIVLDFIHFLRELYVCAVGTFVVPVSFVSQEHT
jgi:hypothetical protein